MIPRKETRISLGEGEHTHEVVVREITPGMSLLLARAVMGDLEETPEKGDVKETGTARRVLGYLLGDVESRLRLLEACTSLQEHVRELGGGDYLRLWQAFEEVNKDFFELLASRLARSAASPEMSGAARTSNAA